MANSINLQYRGRAEYAPDLLRDLGVPEALARMATQQLFLMPVTTDPDAQATMITVQALQRGLGLTANGVLNRATAAALHQVAGERWANRTWGQLVGDVVAFRRAGRNVFDEQESLGDVLPRRLGGRVRDNGQALDMNGVDETFSKTAAIAAGVAVLFLAFSGVRR
jgi:hypothetical protein